MKSKNQIRREKKKLQKQQQAASNSLDTASVPPVLPQINLTDAINLEDSNFLDLKMKFETHEHKVQHTPKRPNMENSDDEDEIPNAELSKKQKRLSAKPEVSYLKTLTSKPELVELCDVDAKEPEYLVYMKSLPNAVSVPLNWRMRSEIPHFTANQSYVLPQNIQKSGIVEAREACKQSNQSSLDIDYDSLQNAVFNPPSDLGLSGYGQPANLRGFYKPKLATKNFERPSKVSDELYKALGLAIGSEMPWAAKVAQLGLSKSYST